MLKPEKYRGFVIRFREANVCCAAVRANVEGYPLLGASGLTKKETFELVKKNIDNYLKKRDAI